MNRREEIYLKGRCPCSECSGTKLDEKLVKWILDFEKKTGLRINITSGARCESYNREVGGYWNSPHLTDVNGIGHAIDFQIKGLKPIEIAYKVDGFDSQGRIGIYQAHIHKDLEIPNPSKYWYVNKEYIYSGNINNLTDFLYKLKREGRLSKNDKDTFGDIIGNSGSVVYIPKKGSQYLGF